MFKLFGRKSNQSTGEEKGVSEENVMNGPMEDPQAEQGKQAGNQPTVSPDHVFGLKFILSPDEAKIFTSLPVTIGRSEQNDIVINDKTVSAVHARVYYDDRVKDVCIVDNDSLNGILIDGYPTYRNLLQDGVRIGLGKVTITFRDTGYIHSES